MLKRVIQNYITFWLSFLSLGAWTFVYFYLIDEGPNLKELDQIIFDNPLSNLEVKTIDSEETGNLTDHILKETQAHDDKLYSLEATDSSGTIDENKADLEEVEEIQTSKIV